MQWSDQFPWYIKQPIDQAAHFAVMFAGVWLWALLLFQFMGVLAAACAGGFIMGLGAGWREGDQLSRREKVKLGDTLLDLFFLWLGAASGGASFWWVMS